MRNYFVLCITLCTYLFATVNHAYAKRRAFGGNQYLDMYMQGGPGKKKQNEKVKKQAAIAYRKKVDIQKNIYSRKTRQNDEIIIKNAKNKMMPKQIISMLESGDITQEEVFIMAKKYIKAADKQIDKKGYRHAGVLLEVLESSPSSNIYELADIHKYLSYCVMKEAKDIRGYQIAKQLADSAIAEGSKDKWVYSMLWLINNQLYGLTQEAVYQQEAAKYNRYKVS